MEPTKRSDELQEDILILQDVADVLKDIAGNDKAFSATVQERGYNPVRFRTLLRDLQPLKRDANKNKDLQLHVNYKADFILSPEEQAYADIFGITSEELCHMELPADFEDTIHQLTKEALSPRAHDIFWLRSGGDTLDQIAEQFQVTRERVRQIHVKSLRILRHPDRQKMLKLGLTEYAKEKRRDIEKQEISEKTLMEAYAERAKEMAREQAVEESEVKGLQEIIFQYLVVGCGHDALTLKYPDRKSIPLDELDLSVRSYNCLHRAGCKTLGDLHKLIVAEKLSKVRNIGKKSEAEIMAKYNQFFPEMNQLEDLKGTEFSDILE